MFLEVMRFLFRTAAVPSCLLIVAWVTLTGFEPARTQGSRTQPTRQEFDEVLRSLMENERAEKSSNSFVWDTDPRIRCVRIPMYPAPDRYSKSDKPLAWYFEIKSNQGVVKLDRNEQIRQLEVLTAAGLLEKQEVVFEADGSRVGGVRYRLTTVGWKASTNDRAPFCLAYGSSHYFGITAIEPKMVNQRAGIDVYTVTVRMGLENQHALPSWARLPEVQAAFPEIAKFVQGEEVQRHLVRGGNGWIPYACLLQPNRPPAHERQCDDSAATVASRKIRAVESVLRNNRFAKEIQRFEAEALSQLEALPLDQQDEIRSAFQSSLHDLKTLPPPTEEDIRNLILKSRQIGGEAQIVAMRLYFSGGYRFKYRLTIPGGSSSTNGNR